MLAVGNVDVGRYRPSPRAVGGGGPHEGPTGFIVLGDEVIDLGNQIFDAGEGAAAHGLFSDVREEALDLIEPGAIGRNEVNMPSWATSQLRLDPRVLVGAVVVYDQVHVQACRYIGFDGRRKARNS